MRRALPALLAAAGPYPQRGDAHEDAPERLAAGIAFRWRRLFSTGLRARPERLAGIREHAARLRAAGSPAGGLSSLRYRLRRDAFHPDAVAECFGAVWATQLRLGGCAPGADAIAAADRLVSGGIVELAERDERLQALGLAATVFAAFGAPVHVLCASDERAALAAGVLRRPLAELGIGTAVLSHDMDIAARRQAYAQPVLFAAWREVALNYLQDQIAGKSAPRALSSRVARLAGGAAPTLLPGLACALVDDADALLVDEAVTPAIIAAEADRSGERLVYEQALEMARTLAPGADFSLAKEGARLTDTAEKRLERFLAPLGGPWAAPGRRRQLIETALLALHAEAPLGDDGEDAAAQDLRGMRDLKEGRRLSARRDVLARLVAGRFFRRYLHLAGVCPDARGEEKELWSLYRLHTVPAGRRSAPLPMPVRVFATTAEKRAAVVAAVAARGGQGVVVAVNAPAEAQALGAAGVPPALLALHPAGARAAPRSRGAAAGAAPHLVVADVHDSPRHLDRLCDTYGVASGEVLLSVEDDPVAEIPLAALLARRPSWLARAAQRRAAAAARLAREEALAREQTLADVLAFSGASS